MAVHLAEAGLKTLVIDERDIGTGSPDHRFEACAVEPLGTRRKTMAAKREMNASERRDDIRKRAEATAREQASQQKDSRSAPSPEASLRLVHELQVHQIELEMQNEELSRAREELEVSHARYFDLYDKAPVGYFTLSESGTIVEANLTAAGLLGVVRSALVRHPLTPFVLREDRRVFSAHLEQFFQAGVPQTFEIQMLRADAEPFWTRVTTSPALDTAGQHVCRAVMSDITELKRAEKERLKAEARLGQLQKAESLGLLAGGIAHHFNLLFQAVAGKLDLAMRDLPPGGKALENLVEAMRAMNRASKLTSQLLTYVGEEVGKLEALDLSAVCRGSLPVLRATIVKDLALETDLPLPGPVVRASANQIHQVLTILVTNAWEAVGESLAVIRLSTRTVSAAAIPAAHRFPVDWQPQDATYACIEVAEKGRGISDENIGKLFDPCFSDGHTGRGLDLPVVLGIVRAHGGAVTVESEPGKGSSFCVFLPMYTEEAPRPAR